MKKQQQDSQQPELLKYKEEHTSCTNYATEQKAIIQIYEEKAHRAITKSVAEKTTLVFVLKGVLHLSLIHISEPTRHTCSSRMPSSA